MADVLVEVAQSLPSVLCRIVWEYTEPVYTCANVTCRNEVAWTTVVGWYRKTTPDDCDSPNIYCCDACIAASFGWYYSVQDECVFCSWRRTYANDDSFFYAYPVTPCANLAICRGS